MASRRILKKTIRQIYNDLALELVVLDMMNGMKKTDETENVLKEVMKISDEFVLRAGTIPGKDNPKLVKEYFRAYFAELDKKNDALEQLIKGL